MSDKRRARQLVAFVTGASGAGKTTMLKHLTAQTARPFIGAQLDQMIKDTAMILDSELRPEERRFTSDPYNYETWRLFLASSPNFESVARRFQDALPANCEALAYLIEGNHFFLARVEEAVRFAVENKPDWHGRNVVVAKFMLDCDPAVVFDQLSRDGRPKNLAEVKTDVQRFRDMMPSRGYKPYAAETIVPAIKQFLAQN